MTPTENRNALERIEYAERLMPFCVCGQPMTPAGRPDGIWLECTSRTDESDNPIVRMLSTISGPLHSRRWIIEADAAA
jgi:hypothetical protein